MSLSVPKECTPCANAIEAYGFDGATTHGADAAAALGAVYFDFDMTMCSEAYLASMDSASRAAIATRVAATAAGRNLFVGGAQ